MPRLSLALSLFLLLPAAVVGVTFDGSLFEDTQKGDAEEHKILGSIFTDHWPDSNNQLILDLDVFKHFFSKAEGLKEDTALGNVEAVKYALRAVDVLASLDVSMPCAADMFHLAYTAVEYATHVEEHRNCSDCVCTPFFQQKKTERHWVFNVVDAMGKVPAGISGGNNLWVGSWHTCRKIKVKKNYQGQLWRGQYCMAHIHAYERDNPLRTIGNTEPVDAHCYRNTTSDGPATNDVCFALFPLLNFGVCVPDSCTEYDVTRMLKFAIRGAEGALGTDSVCNVTVECKRENEENAMSNNGLAMFALYLVIATIVMMIFGSLYDMLIYQKEIEGLSMAEKNRRDAKSSTFLKVILGYSVYRNGSEILKTSNKEGDIECLHGIRFLSMCWIILGHTYYYLGTSLTTDNLIPTLISFPQMFYTQIIVQAPLAVDSFFFLSGMLAAYLFFRKVKFGGIRNPFSIVTWLFIFLKRYTRITPTYAVIMLLDVTLFTYISNGPFWRPIELQGCRIAWWTNFLYLNNWLLQDVECCMGWTWYLANDTQFYYVLYPLLIVIFLKFGRNIGVLVSLLLIVLSSLVHLYIVIINDFPPAPLLTAKLQIVKQLDQYWNYVYVRPYTRCTPFIIGINVGYFLNHLSKDHLTKSIKMKFSRSVKIVGWTTSTILGLYSVFGLYNFAKTGDISEWWKILYVLCGRNAYALALGWAAFACATGNGGPINRFLSWRFFVPLSKCTFCAYLIHPILLQVYNFSRPQPFHFASLMQMLRHTFEAVVVSYICAFFFALAFERPFNALDEILLSTQRVARPPAQNKTTSEEKKPLTERKEHHS
ncbi:hypothetical protein WR25_15490 [Diploscapter pachys]|uniref:Nose resistant-to-fluoxetine protein N-terminal domain-containing protein n=1 Tax=Diploscapter pachys TaxID=2018661 RepID=A0A2A2J3J9_9BILA|nr:hypothetical protein WR25_15490 [Diploscapter pachys]